MKIYQEILEVNKLCKEKFGPEYSGFEVNEFKDMENVVFSFTVNSKSIDAQFYFDNWSKKKTVDTIYQEYDHAFNFKTRATNHCSELLKTLNEITYKVQEDNYYCSGQLYFDDSHVINFIEPAEKLIDKTTPHLPKGYSINFEAHLLPRWEF